MQTFIFLQGAGGGSGMFNLIFFGLIILVFWLFIIRPQAKRQKEQNRFLNDLEKGQSIVTSSGIIGKINKIEGEIVTLEIGTKNYIRVLKSAVSKEMTDSMGSVEEKSSE